jgi:hypothetical protein
VNDHRTEKGGFDSLGFNPQALLATGVRHPDT